MPSLATNRFVDPAVLAGISGLDLVARTVVEGFVAGLHRSPDFGFSQEFAEYRAYTPGDDLRHVDWNVFARTEKMYLKRYLGETNTEVVVILDCSASMNFSSSTVSKFMYAKFLASALIYLAHLQRDSAGMIAFDEEVSSMVRPSGRQGQLMRLLHAIDSAQTGKQTNYSDPIFQLQQFQKRRGITVLISDLLAKPDVIIRAAAPLRYRGNEVILFHLLDQQELEPSFGEPVQLLDMETEESLEVSPEFARTKYRANIRLHIEQLRTEAQREGLDYFLIATNQPLDAALREYLGMRQRRV